MKLIEQDSRFFSFYINELRDISTVFDMVEVPSSNLGSPTKIPSKTVAYERLFLFVALVDDSFFTRRMFLDS